MTKQDLETLDDAITHIRDNIKAAIYPNEASTREAKELLGRLHSLASVNNDLPGGVTASEMLESLVGIRGYISAGLSCSNSPGADAMAVKTLDSIIARARGVK